MQILSFFDPKDGPSGLNHYVSIKAKSDGLLLFVRHGTFESSISIDRGRFKERTKYVAFLSLTDGVVLVEDWRLNSSIENKSFIRDHYRTFGDVCFNVYFHETFDESMLFVNWPVDTDLSVEHVKGNVWLHDLILDRYPDYEGYSKKLVAKRETLASINLVDSVVALEQQIDLLSELVRALLNNTAPPSWVGNFQEILDESSVGTARSIESILSDLHAHKKHVRGVQNKYFGRRG